MKKRTSLYAAFLLAALCLLNTGATAQEEKEFYREEKDFYFGGMAGATEARLTNLDGYRYTFTVQPFRDNTVIATGGESQFNPGFTLGGWAYWNASRYFGVQFGATYSQAGGKLHQTGSETVVDIQIRDSTIVNYEIDHEFETAYVRFPVLAKIQVPTKYVIPYLKAGPEIGILTSAQQETKGWYSTPQLSGSRLYVIEEKENIEANFNKMSFAFDVALGVEFPIKNVAALVEFGYLLGLNDVNAQSAKNFSGDVKNSVMSLTAGIQF